MNTRRFPRLGFYSLGGDPSSAIHLYRLIDLCGLKYGFINDKILTKTKRFRCKVAATNALKEEIKTMRIMITYFYLN